MIERDLIIMSHQQENKLTLRQAVGFGVVQQEGIHQVYLKTKYTWALDSGK